MNRLFEIAKQLKDIALHRFVEKRQLADLETKIAAREVSLIPDGGWAGANADTRKASEKAAKAADAELQELIKLQSSCQESLDNLEFDREILTIEKEAWQWTIRDNETRYSGVKSVFATMKRYQDKQQ
jgi:hypothetical protein